MNFYFSTNSVLKSKQLNIQTPNSQTKVSLLTKEQKTGEFQMKKHLELVFFLTDAC